MYQEKYPILTWLVYLSGWALNHEQGSHSLIPDQGICLDFKFYPSIPLSEIN